MQITEKMLKRQFELLAENLKMPVSKEQAIKENKKHYLRLDHLTIEIAPKKYEDHGYQIALKSIDTGAESYLLGNTYLLKLDQLFYYICGINDYMFIYPQQKRYLDEKINEEV